jgi:hypothetical protein
MTSLSSSNPHAHDPDGPSLDSLSEPKLSIGEQGHEVPLSHYFVEGVGQGNIEGLKMRPFADFHPVDRVELSAERCEVSYLKPLRPLQDRRVVRLDEVVNLTRQLIEAKRRLVADQRLYLYPGLEAFGVDPSCNRLRIRVINVRPKERFRVSSHDQLSIEALCLLLELYCPEGWSIVRSKRASLNTLEALLSLIDSRSALSSLLMLTKGLFVLSSLAVFFSVPLAVWGPDSVSEPLRDVMLPRVEVFLDQLEERRASMKPQATMSVHLSLPLPTSLSPELSAELHHALTEGFKALAGVNGKVSPWVEGAQTWDADLRRYRGDLNELLRQLTSSTSQRLAGRRMLMPSELHLSLSFSPQVASLNVSPASGGQVEPSGEPSSEPAEGGME